MATIIQPGNDFSLGTKNGAPKKSCSECVYLLAFSMFCVSINTNHGDKIGSVRLLRCLLDFHSNFHLMLLVISDYAMLNLFSVDLVFKSTQVK